MRDSGCKMRDEGAEFTAGQRNAVVGIYIGRGRDGSTKKVRSRKPEVGSRKSEVGSWKSGAREEAGLTEFEFPCVLPPQC
jgi:hypothetical protein